MAWHPLRNLGLKAAALFLGVLLWFMVSGHQVTRGMRVDLQYSNVPPEFEMIGSADVATVLVQGDDRIVGDLGPASLRVNVDLHDAHAGENTVHLSPDQVIAPANIEVLQVEPGTVTVTLEKSVRQDARIRPTLDGKPPVGYTVKDVTVDPETVAVVGPESRLRTPMSVLTERVSLDGHTGTVTEMVNVIVTDSKVRVFEPRRVRVMVRIEPEKSSR